MEKMSKGKDRKKIVDEKRIDGKNIEKTVSKQF
jgi:hypothetical protein